MGVRVADLPLYTDPLTGFESLLLESAAGTGRVTYTRLWKPVIRQQASFTTDVLVTGGVEVGVVDLAQVFEVLQVTLSCAARLRLYSSAAALAADADRPATTCAQAGSGLVLEVKSADVLVQPLDPHAQGASYEDVPSVMIPYAVQNLGSNGSVTVTFIFIDRG